MKKLGCFVMVMILGISMSMAQNRGGDFDPEERAKEQTATLKELLDLDKAQEKKVYDINLKAANTMVKMRKEMQDGGDRDAMREKFGEERKKSNAEMKKVLSDTQYEKYEKYQEEQRAQRGQRGGGGGGQR